MTLDEAIKHAKEKAKEQRYYANFERNGMMYQSCVKCAEEHEQLAEWLEQLKEYQQLEEQGKLIKLPCKVGDTVWEYESFGLRQYKVTNIDFDKNWKLYFDCNCGVTYSIRCYIEDFGKRVFLTKKEADNKLNEIKKIKKNETHVKKM